MRRLGTLLLLASIAGADIDSRFAGIWRAKTETSTLTWHIAPSGTYVRRTEGDGHAPGELGTLEAKDGKWSLRAFTMRIDRGTYAFADNAEVTVTGTTGPLIWKRVSKVAEVEKPKDVPAPLAKLTIRKALAAARTHATVWHPDAIFVGAFGMAARDGTFDVSTAPALNLVFYSPAARQGLTLVPTNRGEFMWLAGSGPFGDLVLPVAEDFLDLTEAIGKAAAAGYAVGPANPVNLRAWANQAGGPDKSAWQLGRQPMLKKACFLDAETGARVPWGELSGSDEVLRRLNAWRDGKTHSIPDDFAVWKREADAWAARWSDELKPYEVWISGTWRSGSLAMNHAAFHYFRENRGTVERWSVRIDAGGLKGRRERAGGRRPRPLPEKFVAPTEAVRVLWGLNPQIPPDCTYLSLNYCDEDYRGHWPSAFGVRVSNLGGRVHHRGPVPKNVWVWRMVARRPGAETGVGMAGNPHSHIGVVHCDARTGKALDERAPTFRQTAFR